MTALDEENEKLYREASPRVREIIDRQVQKLVRTRLSPRHNSPQKVETLTARCRREVLAHERAAGWLAPRSPSNTPVHYALRERDEET